MTMSSAGQQALLEACEAPPRPSRITGKATPVAERVWGVNISDIAARVVPAARLLVRIYRKPAQAGYSKADYKIFLPCCVAVTRRMPH